MKGKIKALCLLSGGLDSRLACKIMQEQCEVEAVHFNLPFGSGCCKPDCAFNFTQMQGIKLHVIDCTKGVLFRKYLEIIRKPKHGYGAAINPCIDCHIFMLKEAGKFAKKIGAEVIVTGEVLNERPMSQHLNALSIVEKESGLNGMLLRPLSAKLLEETTAEKKGLVDRERLFAISGRGRKKQLELAKKFNITFPAPAGGCLLCEKGFAVKLRDLFKHEKKISVKDTELLKIGRHFKINGVKVIVGRNEKENKILEKLAKKSDLILEAMNVMGPITLIKDSKDEEIIKKAAELTARYSDAKSEHVVVVVKQGRLSREIEVKKMPVDEVDKLRLAA
jgi:tRNA U34 2-thiouridine synthase MnmA/TrmU